MSELLPAKTAPESRSRSFGLAWACAILSGLVAVGWVADAIATTNLAGHSTWATSALAAAICWIGALASLVLLHALRMRGSPMAGAMLGMLVRMTIPLGILAVAAMQGGSLAGSGLAGQLVVFYLLTLAIETCLSVALMRVSPKATCHPAPTVEGRVPHGC